MAITAISLAYPFGRDQGLYAYIGREWLDGRLPYRDTFDIKTPGIYLVNALAMVLFGDELWAIRALEGLVVVLGGGVLAAWAACPEERRPTPTELSFGAFSLSVSYFGVLDFWNTAQCEGWCGFFLMAALVSVLRGKSYWFVGLAGVFCGVAVIFKPPSMWPALVVLAVPLFRDGRGWWRRGWYLGGLHALRYLALGTIGVGLPIVSLALVFKQLGIFDDFLALHAKFTRFYLVHGSRAESFIEWAEEIGHGIGMFSTFGVVYPLLGLVTYRAYRSGTKSPDGWLLRAWVVLGLGVGVVLMVTMQLKFFAYHWGVMPSVLTLASCLLIQRWRQTGWMAIRRGYHWRFSAWMALGLLCNGYASSMLIRTVTRTVGGVPVETIYDFPDYYSWSTSKQVADFVRSVSDENDQVAVRSFEPQIYVQAKRRYAGYFFWTDAITYENYYPDNDESSERDFQEFQRNPPRFVVTRNDRGNHPILDEWTYLQIGYRPIADFEPMIVLERGEHLDFDQAGW